MAKIKIIHIHTDLKFVDESKRFEGEKFDNTVIMIGDRKDYKGYYKDSALFYKPSLKNFQAIIKSCKDATMVVLFDLNFPKAYIANRLPASVKIIWRFFGTELYSKMPEYVYSGQTIKYSEEENKRFELFYFRNKIASLFNILRFKTNFNIEFNKAAFSRIDYFLGFSEKEHRFLKEFWPKLPPFLQISYDPYPKVNIYPKNGSKLIIGNNRSAFNNHLDIIDLIEKSSQKSKFQFLMLFSYGQNNAYANAVRARAAEVKEIHVIEEFLAMDKLSYMYAEAGALVINGHRQMAMFNIFLAIYVNTKIYLNEKNITLDWLKEEGFLVFTINDLIADLEKGNLKLTEEETIHNQNQLIKFTARYNHQEFHNSLLKLLKRDVKSEYQQS